MQDSRPLGRHLLTAIASFLVRMGYGGSRPDAARQLGRSGDGGADGVINEDRLGLDRVYVQAKRYAEGNVIGRPAVQNFVGSLVGMGATKGVFVTTSKFSGDAIEFAGHLTQRVILIEKHPRQVRGALPRHRHFDRRRVAGRPEDPPRIPHFSSVGRRPIPVSPRLVTTLG